MKKQENSHSGDLVTRRHFKLRPPDHETEILTIRTSPPITIALQVYRTSNSAVTNCMLKHCRLHGFYRSLSCSKMEVLTHMATDNCF